MRCCACLLGTLAGAACNRCAECVACVARREQAAPGAKLDGCSNCGTVYGTEVECKEAAAKVAAIRVSSWVYGVSTGHSGSQSLSAKSCYGGMKQGFAFGFEANWRYGDSGKNHVADPHPILGIQALYAAARTRDEAGHLMEEFAQQVLIPDQMLGAAGKEPGAEGNHTIIDIGHHINLGLIEPLAALLQPRVRFVRLIRSRYDTVRSFMYESKWPCGAGRWTLCPQWHVGVVLEPPSEAAWDGLSSVQRNLWFVDEVEARWQRVLERHPLVPRLTMRWCTSEQFTSGWRAVAAFIGGGALTLQKCSHHHHGSANLSDAELADADTEYRRAMLYSQATLKVLEAVQVPLDCTGETWFSNIPLR